MKSVNIKLDGMNSIEITQIGEELFEVCLTLDGKISLHYMTREQLTKLGSTFHIEGGMGSVLNIL